MLKQLALNTTKNVATISVPSFLTQAGRNLYSYINRHKDPVYREAAVKDASSVLDLVGANSPYILPKKLMNTLTGKAVLSAFNNAFTPAYR